MWEILPDVVGEPPAVARPVPPGTPEPAPPLFLWPVWRPDMVVGDDLKSLRDLNAGELLAAARAERIDELRELREAIKRAAFLYDGNWYDCDLEGQAAIMGQVQEITAGPPTSAQFPWKDADNEWRMIGDADAFRTFATTLSTHYRACLQRFGEIEYAINASPDPATVDIYQGWPPTRVAEVVEATQSAGAA